MSRASAEASATARTRIRARRSTRTLGGNLSFGGALVIREGEGGVLRGGTPAIRKASGQDQPDRRGLGPRHSALSSGAAGWTIMKHNNPSAVALGAGVATGTAARISPIVSPPSAARSSSIASSTVPAPRRYPPRIARWSPRPTTRGRSSRYPLREEEPQDHAHPRDGKARSMGFSRQSRFQDTSRRILHHPEFVCAGEYNPGRTSCRRKATGTEYGMPFFAWERLRTMNGIPYSIPVAFPPAGSPP